MGNIISGYSHVYIKNSTITAFVSIMALMSNFCIIRVVVSNTFLAAPISITPFNGQELSLELIASSTLNVSVTMTGYGQRLFNITWLHDDRVLVDGEERVTITNIYMSQGSLVSSMLLHSSLIPKDSGFYEVRASNIFGSGSLIFNVSVTGEK